MQQEEHRDRVRQKRDYTEEHCQHSCYLVGAPGSAILEYIREQPGSPSSSLPLQQLRAAHSAPLIQHRDTYPFPPFNSETHIRSPHSTHRHQSSEFTTAHCKAALNYNFSWQTCR
eukprot:GHVN01010950.1.p1 GENE.GHVN01010950.1~~GHVN01010950.1.p1  ORF type:complete len:115 (+),score=12.47 GHVN01010950.1:1310-1654(+)